MPGWPAAAWLVPEPAWPAGPGQGPCPVLGTGGCTSHPALHLAPRARPLAARGTLKGCSVPRDGQGAGEGAGAQG